MFPIGVTITLGLNGCPKTFTDVLGSIIHKIKCLVDKMSYENFIPKFFKPSNALLAKKTLEQNFQGTLFP